MREIILDTETTGLDWREGHRIVEIGCLELMNHLPTGRTLQHYVNPEREISQGALDVHGITLEQLATKPCFREIVHEFLEFLSDAPILIHNAPFDIGFLNYELSLIGLPPLPQSRVRCTLEMARGKYPGAQNSLDALCRRFSIDNSARTRHGALLDAELLAEVYLELIGGRQPALILAERSLTLEAARPSAARVRPRPLSSFLSEEERLAHEAFLATLGGDPVWSWPAVP